MSWIANDFPPWATNWALVACLEIAPDKDSTGTHSIGIGNIFWHAVANCILVVASLFATTECGSDQVCVGLKAGVDNVVYAVLAGWAEMDTTEQNNFLVIDADNALNAFFLCQHAFKCTSPLACRCTIYIQFL